VDYVVHVLVARLKNGCVDRRKLVSFMSLGKSTFIALQAIETRTMRTTPSASDGVDLRLMHLVLAGSVGDDVRDLRFAVLLAVVARTPARHDDEWRRRGHTGDVQRLLVGGFAG